MYIKKSFPPVSEPNTFTPSPHPIPLVQSPEHPPQNYYGVFIYHSLKDVSSTAHTQICNFCSYTITSAHTYLTSSYNSSTHTRVCKVCDHTITESHTPNSAGTLCTGCSFTGPFSSIIQKLPEDTELQTLLPETPSLCCDDHAAH